MDIISQIFSIKYIIFSFGGQHVSLIEFLGFVVGFICVFLAGRNNKANFWFGYIYNIILLFLFLQWHLYSAMLLQPISFIINAIGQWKWTHPKPNEEASDKSLKVSSLSIKSKLYIIIGIGFFTLIWGFVLSNLGKTIFVGSFIPDPKPFLDAFVVVLTLYALYLSAMKKWECWILWFLVNIFNFILYISTGLSVLAIVCVLYIINGIVAIYTWYKLYKKENNGK